MSDHDPIDRQYAEAEAVLDDEAARATRRAKVLAAVATAQPDPAKPALSTRRPLWGQGRWLAAAGVAGIGMLVGLRFYLPTPLQPEPPAAPPAAVAPAVPDAPAEPAARLATASPPPSTPARPAGPASAAARSAPDAQVTAAQAPPPPPAAPPRAEAVGAPPAVSSAQMARAAPAPAEERSEVESVVVTSARSARAAKAADAAAPAPSPAKAASLRAAAAAGRTAELRALLNEGMAVDTPDQDGETALMKAVRAKQSAAATLLRRQGADPDLKNHAGQSARDLAADLADPALDRALGPPK